MSDPVIQPVLQPGQPGYRDHASLALSRLPEQFRQERLDLPVRPKFVGSGPATFEIVHIGLSTFNNVVVSAPVACLQGDTLLLVIVADFANGIPLLPLPQGWTLISTVSTTAGFWVSLLRHDVSEFEPDSHTIPLVVTSPHSIGCGVVAYRYLDAGTLVIGAAAADADSISPPTPFPCPSQTTTTTTDMYLGVTWSVFGPVETTVPADCTTRLSVNQTVDGTTGLQLTVFDFVSGTVGPTGAKNVSVDAGCSGVAASFLLRFFLPDFDHLNTVGRLVASLCRPIQDLENTMQQVLLQRSLDNAVGAQLDTIGKLVGQPRNGLDDDTYRRYCRAAIAAHRSIGTPEDLYVVASLVEDDPDAKFVVSQQQVATVVFQVTGVAITDDVAEILFLFLRQATAAGARLVLQYGNTDPVFRLDQSPGLDQGHLGGEISD